MIVVIVMAVIAILLFLIFGAKFLEPLQNIIYADGLNKMALYKLPCIDYLGGLYCINVLYKLYYANCIMRIKMALCNFIYVNNFVGLYYLIL